MAAHIKDKKSARNATRIAQGSALLLAIAGGAVAVAGLPGLDVPDIEPAPVGPIGSGIKATPTDTDTTPLPDVYVIGDNLSYIGNAPVPQAVLPDVPDEPVPDSGITEREVRFIGSIKSGGRAAAFVNIAGVTKVLRPGEVYDGVKLVEVVGNEIAISIDGGEEEMIRKDQRQGSGVSVVTGGAPTLQDAAGTKAIAGDLPELSPDMSSEERLAVLRERTKERRSRWQRDRGNNGGPPN
ncbi:MAG: hypothetical protein Q9O74_00440 [Planctomycetota bacterium]|nr:hypothetical protein [Planctomycetota bacterium]